MNDTSRPAATNHDTQFSLSIEDAAALYALAGHPRTLRTVQRYCASGHLDCVKAQTMLGDKYFVEPSSVGRHIAQIEELVALNTRSQGLGVSRHDATPVVDSFNGAEQRHDSAIYGDQPRLVAQSHSTISTDESYSSNATPADTMRPTPTEATSVSRHDATEDVFASRYVAQLEKDVERLAEDRDFLRGQIATKDNQIAALLERDRETNILVRGLQQMLSPLLGSPRKENGSNDHRQSEF